MLEIKQKSIAGLHSDIFCSLTSLCAFWLSAHDLNLLFFVCYCLCVGAHSVVNAFILDGVTHVFYVKLLV